MEYAAAKAEAAPTQADDVMHLGGRAAVVRALSLLVRSKRFLRVRRAVYIRPLQTRFGLRAPSLERAITGLASLWVETIVLNGGDAANWLGLTTHNAVRTVYLTSATDRLANVSGRSQVELLQIPRVGIWRPPTEPLARSSGRSHGSVPTRLREVWMPCCRSSRRRAWTNASPRRLCCPVGWQRSFVKRLPRRAGRSAEGKAGW